MNDRPIRMSPVMGMPYTPNRVPVVGDPYELFWKQLQKTPEVVEHNERIVTKHREVCSKGEGCKP